MSSILRSAIKLVVLIIAFIWVINYAKKNACHKGVIFGISLLFVGEIINAIFWLILHSAELLNMSSEAFLKFYDVLTFVENLEALPMDIFLILVLVEIISRQRKAKAE